MTTVPRALFSLWRGRVDLYFDLEVYSHAATLLSVLSLARNRYGFFRQSCRFKLGLHTHLLYLNCLQHVAGAYAQMARAAGAGARLRLQPPVLTPEERVRARGFAGEVGAGIPEPRLLCVNANASDLLLERRWPPERFVELIERVLARPDMRDVVVVLIGSPGEREYLRENVFDRLSGGARARVALAAGELSLFETLAVLERSCALVTNDSGPMHFAFALGVPTVSLWGPGLPAHYGPFPGMPGRVVYAGAYCSPCLYHTEPPPCRGNNFCMTRIDADTVLAALVEVIGAGGNGSGVTAAEGSTEDPAAAGEDEPLAVVVSASAIEGRARV